MFSISLKTYFFGKQNSLYTSILFYLFNFSFEPGWSGQSGKTQITLQISSTLSLLPIQAGWSFRTIFVIFFIIIILITLFSEFGSWGISIQTIRMTMKLKLLLSETNEKRNESVIWVRHWKIKWKCFFERQGVIQTIESSWRPVASLIATLLIATSLPPNNRKKKLLQNEATLTRQSRREQI